MTDEKWFQLFRFDDVEVSEANGTVIRAGESQSLPPRYHRVLVAMLRAPMEVFDHKTIDKLINHPNVDEERRKCMTVIRKAINTPGGQNRIENRHGRGYRFVGTVTQTNDISRRVVSKRAFSEGDTVPHRDHLVLLGLLWSSEDAETWRARDASGQTAIVKFACSGNGTKRLRRERDLMRALAQGVGPTGAYPRCVDSEFEHDAGFIVMEDKGPNLFDWSQTEAFRALGLASRMDLAEQLVAAVAGLHRRGIKHCDIKPSNVAVAPAGEDDLRVALIDFGGAVIEDPERFANMSEKLLKVTLHRQSVSDDTLGTRRYLALELVNNGVTTYSTDVYALGVLVREIILGEIVKQVGGKWEEQISDRALRLLLKNATSDDPLDRPQTAVEFARALGSLEAENARLEARDELGRREEEQKRRDEARRARRPLMIASAVGAVLSFGAISAFALGEQAARRQAQAESARSQIYLGVLEGAFAQADPRSDNASPIATVDELLNAATNSAELLMRDRPEDYIGLLNYLASIRNGRGDVDEEVRLRRRIVEMSDLAFGQTSQESAEHRLALADALIRAQDAKALNEVKALLQEARLRLDPDRTAPRLFALASVLEGTYASREARFSDAISAYTTALDSPDGAPVGSRIWFRAQMGLMDSHARLGELEEALAIHRLFRDFDIGSTELTRADLILPDEIRARALMIAQRPDEAEAVLLESLERTKTVFGTGHYRYGTQLMLLAAVKNAEGDAETALGLVEQATEVLCREFPLDNQVCLAAQINRTILSASVLGPASAYDSFRAYRDRLDLIEGDLSASKSFVDYKLALLALELGEIPTAKDLVSRLDPDLIAIVSQDPAWLWPLRIDVVRARVELSEGDPAARTKLEGLLKELEEKGAPLYDVEPHRDALNLP